MTLKYKVGDLVTTNMNDRNYMSIPNGTLVRITRIFGDFGYYIDHPESKGWWSEMQLIPYNVKEVKPKSGFGKWIEKHGN